MAFASATARPARARRSCCSRDSSAIPGVGCRNYAFYAEIARVLAPGGRPLFHDIFQGGGGSVHFPVPWAEDSSISFLVAPEVARDILGELGFTISEWEDKSQLRWTGSLQPSTG